MVKKPNKSYGKRSFKWTKKFLKRTKTIIREYMKKNNILEVEINWRKGKVLTLEPVKNRDRALFLDMWLKGELPTDKLEENMKLTYWYVQYYLDDFLNEIVNPNLNMVLGREER